MDIFIPLLSTSCLVALVLYLHHRWQHRHIMAAAAKFPSPPTFPFLGNVQFISNYSSSFTEKVTRTAAKYKGNFCLWMGSTPFFVITRISDAKIIFNTSDALEKADGYKFLKPILGNGLITGPVKKWKKSRRLINPVFHPSNLGSFIPVFNDVSRQLMTSLVENSSPLPVDPKQHLMWGVLNAANRMQGVGFHDHLRSPISVSVEVPRDPSYMDHHFSGTIFGGRVTPDELLMENLEYIFNWSGTSFVMRYINPILQVDWIHNLIFRSKEMKSKKCASEIDEVFRESIIKYKMDMATNTGLDSTKIHKQGNTTEAPGLSMMDVIVNDSSVNLSDKEWRDEFITMLAGATDTVVSSLSLLMTTLGNHPEVQDKLQSEVQDVVGDSNKDVTLEDLKRMKYLDQVILENLRLHGVIPLIGRAVTGNIKIGNDITLPPGSNVLISLHAMGWDPEVFPEPHMFIPERFSPDEDQKIRSSDLFIPFSAGPRNCIGKSYSMLLMKTMMVHILRKYMISSEVKMEDLKYEHKIVIYSIQPLLIRLKERRITKNCFLIK